MKKATLTKVLEITGTILAGLPIAAPIILSLLSLIFSGRFRFDYLMPAELFFFSLAGAAALIWAAIRAHTRLRLLIWSLGIGVLFLFGGQGLAMVTGLADGRISEESPWMILVTATIALFSLAMVALFIGGILLCRDVFRMAKSTPE